MCNRFYFVFIKQLKCNEQSYYLIHLHNWDREPIQPSFLDYPVQPDSHRMTVVLNKWKCHFVVESPDSNEANGKSTMIQRDRNRIYKTADIWKKIQPKIWRE